MKPACCTQALHPGLEKGYNMKPAYCTQTQEKGSNLKPAYYTQAEEKAYMKLAYCTYTWRRVPI